MENENNQPGRATPLNSPAKEKLIILAGANGHLGRRIASHLLDASANVKALVRKSSKPSDTAVLEKRGAIRTEVDFDNAAELKNACSGGTCLVSAVNGLKPVMIGVQTSLLQAAIAAGVPRFIPSDYCIDYTKLADGSNRNLDLRRQFAARLDGAAIAATSIFNGMFTDLLTGQAPLILFKFKRILYWGNAEQLLDFTTLENTAAYTARAALDSATPRYLRIAGEATNIYGLQKAATEAEGKKFELLRAGGLGLLQTMIKITRTLAPGTNDVFPPWQGMQYMHNMFTGRPKLSPLDNERYTGIHWTSVREVLEKRHRS